jgi:tripartite ATP-independent transporter DctP family solute receptor
MKRTLALIMIAAAVFALGGCGKKDGSPASGAQKTIKVRMAHTGSEQTVAHQSFLVIKEEMEKNSGGVFQVDIYPAGQIGNDPQLIEAVQTGDIEMMFTNTGLWASFVPEVSVFAVPFAFPSKEVAFKVLDGDFGKYILGMMEEKAGAVGLSFIEAVAYRQLTANRVIRTPDELNGLKIRVMTNPIQLAIWSTLGAQPTAITFGELYTALQQKTVDAQENPVELIVASKFYEVQKQLIMTNHVFQCGIFVANPAWFHSLSPDLQQIARDAAARGTVFQRTKTAEDYEVYLKTLRDNGVTITELTDAEMRQWKDKVQPAMPAIAKEVGGQEVVDRMLAAIEAAK